MYKSLIKIVSKFVEKLLKYRIMFKDILTFLEFDYRDVSHIILKKQINGMIMSHKNLF